MIYVKIAALLWKIFTFWLNIKHKNEKIDQLELTNKEQKAYDLGIKAIDKAEKHLNRKLDSVSSLRKRAEQINRFKDSNV